MNLHDYYALYGSRITQESERLFVDEFLYPMLGSLIEQVVPQHPFLDRTGSARRIDFAVQGSKAKIALEVNGETYHAEGIIPTERFDENLFRQNEILRQGYKLVRFSLHQLESPVWRPLVNETLRDLFGQYAPELLSKYALTPTPLQKRALEALEFFRIQRGWKRGIIVLPTGTGKTILSALDARRVGGRVLFVVHRLDILAQSIDAYRVAWPDMKVGQLTGEVEENLFDCDVLFASKDSLRRTETLERFGRSEFHYIVIDEVHHGQSPTYREVLEYFTPEFMVGMTATPDRTDRKDIFELFEYRKILEVSLQEAIEEGFLVPYTYYGLTDDIDYSKIRFQGQRYRVDDLERMLIIPERNNAIIREYLEKGQGDKAIGFCVSIKHAERMAEVFNANGITAAAIHSEAKNRDSLLTDFRQNKIQVAFTVDLFNEGVDFPNVRVLLFLRPTESKTVFMQQLGRGLRLCAGKDRVRVLDFIGNYKRANQIRKFLATASEIQTTNDDGRTRRKIQYEYARGCEVHFDAQVEEILDAQDALELGVTKDELKEAYFALAEKLGAKPSKSDLDGQGEYKSVKYLQAFGSWTAFLREVGEYTEASYHYPQGTHLGHLLSVLKVFANKRAGSHFGDEFVKFRGGLSEGRVGNYQRQVKYKLQAAMELGIIHDDRDFGAEEDFPLEVTGVGRQLYEKLEPQLNSLDLDFQRGEDGVPSTQMKGNEEDYNRVIREACENDPTTRKLIYSVFLRMPAVLQMLHFLFHVCQRAATPKMEIYEQFFQAPKVKRFCDSEGIDEATLEAAKRRCPFLLNILESLGVISNERSGVVVRRLLLTPMLVKSVDGEDDAVAIERLRKLKEAWPTDEGKLTSEDLSILRELFGATFLTEGYEIKELEIIEGV